MSPLSESNIAELRDRLLALREELESLAAIGDEAAGVVTLDQTKIGRLSRMDAMQAQSMSLETQRRREVQLKDIARALRRIEQNRYGFCLECEEPVNIKRLQFDPAVEHCLDCAEELNASTR